MAVEWKEIYREGGTDVAVADGGTGASTLADGGIVIGNGTSAVEVVTPGATTEILVGGGAATKPVWTTATGTGAPVRATSPALVTPALGTPASGVLTNCTGLPIAGGGTGASTAAGACSALGVGTEDSPTFTGLTVSGLTASLPVFTNGSKALESKSVADTMTALKAMPAGVYELIDGATIAVDWNNGATQYVVLGATGRTVTFANPVNGAVYRFIIIQDGTGSRTITTWPTVKWAGGAAPTLSTDANAEDVVTLLYADGAYYGDCLAELAAPA